MYTQFLWCIFFNVNSVTPVLHRRVKVQEEGNLLLTDTRKEDSGMYVCIAHNIAGEKESNPARLAVLGEWIYHFLYSLRKKESHVENVPLSVSVKWEAGAMYAHYVYIRKFRTWRVMLCASCFAEKPTFSKPPSDKQVEENDDVQFQCEATGDPPPTIIWKKEDGHITPDRYGLVAQIHILLLERQLWGWRIWHCVTMCALQS